MMNKPQLRMTFDPGGFDSSFTMTIPLSEHVVNDFHYIKPLGDRLEAVLGMVTMEETVEILRARECRKDVVTKMAQSLGTMLAERMEDAEGWHDISRIEPAKKQLRG